MTDILIIDDEKPIRMMLRTLFEKEGFNVFDASNGNEGFKIFEEKKPDVLILDMLMPEKDGIETMMSIKKIHPDTKIIAISGGGVVNPDIYLNLAQKLGARHTFQKPIERNMLLSAVKSVLKEI